MKSSPARPSRRTTLQQLTAKAKRTAAQDALAFQLRTLGPSFHSEYAWHHSRNYRADFVCVQARLIVEVDGGLFINGGHTRGAARERDYERDAEAMLLGFRVLRVSPRHVKNGKAIAWIQQLLSRPSVIDDQPYAWHAGAIQDAKRQRENATRRIEGRPVIVAPE